MSENPSALWGPACCHIYLVAVGSHFTDEELSAKSIMSFLVHSCVFIISAQSLE